MTTRALVRNNLLVLALLVAPAFAQPATLQTFKTAPLAIDTAKGSQHFTVELALTPAQQEQGLMFRRQLAADAGMLFVAEQPQVMQFWMHDTYMPLDMVFIGTGGRIVDMHQRAVPMSDAIIVSRAPAIAVLEVNGGTVDRLGIKVGDMVRAAALGDTAN